MRDASDIQSGYVVEAHHGRQVVPTITFAPLCIGVRADNIIY